VSSSDSLPHKDALTNTPALRTHVENFAENKQDYHDSLKTGFVKLCDLGHAGDELIDIEYFLNDEPNSKLRFPG
jgi:hypothetical protein